MLFLMLVCLMRIYAITVIKQERHGICFGMRYDISMNMKRPNLHSPER